MAIIDRLWRLLLTTSWRCQSSPFPWFLLAILFFFSHLIVGRTNIWIEMPWILKEDLICWVSVFHVLRDGDMSETATLILKGAKNDIAHSQRCTQRTYVPTILDVSTNISHMGHAGGFLFCRPLLWRALTRISRVFFVAHVAMLWGRWETWTPACKQWFFELLEGHFIF